MSRQVHGEGPVPAAVMLIGQRPGQEEVRRNRPFCGKSGLELDRYLRCVGIDRASCYVTNLVRTFDGEDEITPEEIERDWPALMQEVEQVQPQYVGLVGLYAARAFLGDDIELDWANGLAWPPDKWPFWLMPLTHPAAGLHMPTQAIKVAHAFEEFGNLVKGEELSLAHLQDAVPTPSYNSSSNIAVADTLGVDTEGTVQQPWCFSVSSTPGTGTVCRDRYYKLRHIVCHHMLHDMPVLQSLGVSWDTWTDTMLMAALLGTEPHGLKALARRWCGMHMSDYSDVVREARREKALEYIGKVVEWMEPDPPKTKAVKKSRRKRTLTEELEAVPIPPHWVSGDPIQEDDIPF